MFANFIYFIVVLLIYATYQPAEDTYFSRFEALSLFCLLAGLFAVHTRAAFMRVVKRMPHEGYVPLDQRFSATLTRQSVLAVFLFAVDIYGLGMTRFVEDLPLFTLLPTLQAAVFLALFVGYMAIVWAFAHEAYQRLYARGIPRGTYVLSNISFSLPVLLPWLALSMLSDLVYVLPFEQLRRLLSTTIGEAVYFLIFLMIVAVIGPAMIQKFWRCTPLEEGAVRSRIRQLCRRAGVRYADILYWPIFGGRMITAGVMGLIRRFRYILVTRALLQALKPEEIDAVIAHEIGHVKKKHLFFYLFFFAGYLLLSYATFDLIVFAVLFVTPVAGFMTDLGLQATTVSSAMFSLMFILIFLVYFRFIFGYFMRNFERQADAYVFSLFDTAQPLVSTMQKIALSSGQPADKPNWHHFGLQERIDFLNKCESDRRWIVRHDRKIRKSIAVYLAGIACVGLVGYQLGYGEPGRRLSAHFFERVIEDRIAENPADPELYRLQGDFYYSRGNYAGAVDAYEKSLSLDPRSPEVLNNLAWLYATSEEERLRDPVRALSLAREAAARETAPHILDTLAQSHYVNGNLAEAVAAAEEALALATENRSYFKDQLEKFRRAMQ